MGYSIIFFANVAISNPSELIGLRRSRFVFIEIIRVSRKATIPMPKSPDPPEKSYGRYMGPPSQQPDLQRL
jgi:hypothetical protein